MLTQLQPIRAALKAAIEEMNVPVFAQRKINEEDVESDRFVALTLSRSDEESAGVGESWAIAMVLGVYILNPATDDELETFAADVLAKINTSGAVNTLVSGVLFAGHEYPEEQGDAFASLDVQYTIIIDN
jgi:hypothetical protein